MKYDIYLASPFFTKRQKKIVQFVARKLRNQGYKIFVPMEHKISDGDKISNNEWAKKVFDLDVKAINESSVVFALYWGFDSDSGTSWEMGYAYGIHKPVMMLVINASDIVSIMNANGSKIVLNDINELNDKNILELAASDVNCHIAYEQKQASLHLQHVISSNDNQRKFFVTTKSLFIFIAPY